MQDVHCLNTYVIRKHRIYVVAVCYVHFFNIANFGTTAKYFFNKMSNNSREHKYGVYISILCCAERCHKVMTYRVFYLKQCCWHLLLVYQKTVFIISLN